MQRDIEAFLMAQDTYERITHGRHCRCSSCAREDWSHPDLASCGMHGETCPGVYDPRGRPGDVVPTETARAAADRFFADAALELDSAMRKWPATHSPHEAYAVIKEELDEFWEEVRRKQTEHDPAAMYAELMQIAAMAARAAVDVVMPTIIGPRRTERLTIPGAVETRL